MEDGVNAVNELHSRHANSFTSTPRYDGVGGTRCERDLYGIEFLQGREHTQTRTHS